MRPRANICESFWYGLDCPAFLTRRVANVASIASIASLFPVSYRFYYWFFPHPLCVYLLTSGIYPLHRLTFKEWNTTDSQNEESWHKL